MPTGYTTRACIGCGRDVTAPCIHPVALCDACNPPREPAPRCYICEAPLDDEPSSRHSDYPWLCIICAEEIINEMAQVWQRR